MDTKLITSSITEWLIYIFISLAEQTNHYVFILLIYRFHFILLILAFPQLWYSISFTCLTPLELNHNDVKDAQVKWQTWKPSSSPVTSMPSVNITWMIYPLLHLYSLSSLSRARQSNQQHPQARYFFSSVVDGPIRPSCLVRPTDRPLLHLAPSRPRHGNDITLFSRLLGLQVTGLPIALHFDTVLIIIILEISPLRNLMAKEKKLQSVSHFFSSLYSFLLNSSFIYLIIIIIVVVFVWSFMQLTRQISFLLTKSSRLPFDWQMLICLCCCCMTIYLCNSNCPISQYTNNHFITARVAIWIISFTPATVKLWHVFQKYHQLLFL